MNLPAQNQDVERLERRCEPRKKALIHAFVSDFDGLTDLKCVICEISKGGCRIASSYVEDLPKVIQIFPEGFEKPLVGKVVWSKEKYAGVQFVSDAEAEEIVSASGGEEIRPPARQGFFSKLFSFATLRRKSGHVHRDDERTSAEIPSYGVRALNAVRQPISAIRNLLGLLMGDAIQPIPRRAKSVIGAAHKNAAQAEAMLGDALQADNINAGKIKCHIEPVEIVELVQDAALMSTGHAAQYDVRFEVNDEVGSAMVEADPTRLQETIRCLLVVAARYSPVKEAITIGIHRSGGKIRVSVADKGTGTSVLHGDADGKHVTREADDDLELDVARSILTQHKSELHFDADAGRGTVAWFELSVHAA